MTYNGNIGFVKTSELTSKKGGDSTKDGDTKKDSKKAVSADWFKSNIQSKFYKGRVVTVTDVSTKISFKVKRKGGQYHADVEPYSSSDTAAMKKACGSDFMTWHRRAIWVTIDGTKYVIGAKERPYPAVKITRSTGRPDGDSSVRKYEVSFTARKALALCSD